MQELPCVHTKSYACSFNCNSWSQNSHQEYTEFLAETLPSWTYSASRSVLSEESDGERSAFGKSIKRRRCGRLTFLDGSFRPLIVLDDDDDDDDDNAVIPRPLLRAGRDIGNPIILDDELPGPLAALDTPSSAIDTRDVKEPLNETLADVSLSLSESYLQPSSEPTPYSIPQTSVGWHDDWAKTQTRCGMGQEGCLIKNRSISLPPTLRPIMESDFLASWSSTKAISRLYNPLPSQVSDSCLSKKGSRKTPRNVMSIKDRKRFFIHTPTPSMITAMRRDVSLTYALLDGFREPEDCWLHPYPPPPKHNGRARGTITFKYHWRDALGAHSLAVNLGIVVLLVESSLTEAQKEGYVNDKWHLSHLCGNWTCCNWRHLTVEAGSINISRNACFMLSETCLNHTPLCMKSRKRQLSSANHTSKEDCCNSDSEHGYGVKTVVDYSSFLLTSPCAINHNDKDNIETSKEVHKGFAITGGNGSEDSGVDGTHSDQNGREDVAPIIYS